MPIGQCPTCDKPFEYQQASDAPSRPFCSHRCQMIDLGKWLNEDYRVSEPLDANPEGAVGEDENSAS